MKISLWFPLPFGYQVPVFQSPIPNPQSPVANRLSLISLLLVIVAAGSCSPPPGAGEPPRQSAAAQIVRTADPERRGFTETDFPRLQELAPGVFSYEQLRSSGDERFTTVSLIVTTPEGVLVADGQGSPEETRRLLEEIGKITDQPVTHVVICSDHGDHTGGNRAFPEQAVFLAHPTSRATLQEQARRQAESGRGDPPVIPTELVEKERTMVLGGRTIRILFLGRAHTGGDLSVYLPEEKILFMSEAYLNRIFPAMRSAYPSEWVATIGRAQALDADIYVPGHGFVESAGILKEELATFKSALQKVIAETVRLHDLGLTAEEAAAQARFGDLEGWSLRSSQGSRAIERVYQELNRELPGSPAGR